MADTPEPSDYARAGRAPAAVWWALAGLIGFLILRREHTPLVATLFLEAYFGLVCFGFWRLCTRAAAVLSSPVQRRGVKLLAIVVAGLGTWLLAVLAFLPFISLC